MRTHVQMAHRSDRREGKPSAHWGNKARAHDWLLARDFHFGQEGSGAFPPTPLLKQAGDTTARLTYRCHQRLDHREGWNKFCIRRPTLTIVRETPQPPALPPQAWINPPPEKTTLQVAAGANRSTWSIPQVPPFSASPNDISIEADVGRTDVTRLPKTLIEAH